MPAISRLSMSCLRPTLDFMMHAEHWRPEGERQWVANTRTAFPDIRFTVEAQVARRSGGDALVVQVPPAVHIAPLRV
jgi:hypothetical protein